MPDNLIYSSETKSLMELVSSLEDTFWKTQLQQFITNISDKDFKAEHIDVYRLLEKIHISHGSIRPFIRQLIFNLCDYENNIPADNNTNIRAKLDKIHKNLEAIKNICEDNQEVDQILEQINSNFFHYNITNLAKDIEAFSDVSMEVSMKFGLFKSWRIFSKRPKSPLSPSKFIGSYINALEKEITRYQNKKYSFRKDNSLQRRLAEEAITMSLKELSVAYTNDEGCLLIDLFMGIENTDSYRLSRARKRV